MLTWRQWIGLPFIFGLPVLALLGRLGPDRAALVGRMALVYVLVVAAFRVLGKRELSQMSPIELVTLLFLAQLFRNAIMRSDETMLSAVVAAFTLFALVYVMSFLSYHLGALRRVVQPSASVLVTDGHPDDSALDRERVTEEDILSAVRKAGFERLDDVHFAMLEADGRISIVPRDGSRRAIPRGDS